MKLSRRVQDERAQGVVEFAFIITVLMLLFLGTVDYARFLYYDTAIRSAARVGAEYATNHCTNETNCPDPLSAQNAVTDPYILWATYCEANPYVSLQPSYSSCTPGTDVSWAPSCAVLACQSCTNDICVYPATRKPGDSVTVSVGYTFHPIAFMLDWIFTAGQCWTAAGGASQDDSIATNGHTLCATSVGRVS